MRRGVFWDIMAGVGFFAFWGALFTVPHVLLWSGHLWWAAFAAFASLLILGYEYQGAVGFVFLPGLLRCGCSQVQAAFLQSPSPCCKGGMVGRGAMQYLVPLSQLRLRDTFWSRPIRCCGTCI